MSKSLKKILMKKFLLFLITLLFAASSTWAAILPVPSVPFPTIQSAILVANPGDIIQVAAGVYPENLDFTNHPGVTLMGAGKGSTTIQAVPPGITAGGVIVEIWVPVPGVTLTGFTLQGFGPTNTTQPQRGIKFQGPWAGAVVCDVEVKDFRRTALEFFLCNGITVGAPAVTAVPTIPPIGPFAPTAPYDVVLHDVGYGRGLSLVVVNGALVQNIQTYNNEWCGMAVQSRSEPAYAPGISTGVVISGTNNFGENTWVNAAGQINGGLVTEQDAPGFPITVGCSSFFDVFIQPVDFSFALTWIPSPAGYPQSRFFQTYAQAFASLPVPIPAGLTPDIRQLCGPITTVVSQTACPNSVVSVPIVLSEGWNNLESISLMLLYDQNVLQFQSAVVDPGIPGATANGVNGVFTLGYFGPGALTTPTLATLNFKVLSCSNTGITNLTWAYNPTGAVPPDLSSNEYFPPFSPTNPVPYFQDPFGTYFVNGTVNVTDGIAPTITCPGPVTWITDPNLCTAAVTWLPAYTHSIPAARNNGAYTEDSWLWQAFDVPVSGILTGIQINVRNNYGPFTVKLYKGDGNAGCPLYSASYTPTGTGLQTIPIPRSVGVYLTTGQVYTFEAKGVISGCTPSIDLWCTYSGGGPVYTRNVWDNWVPCGGLGVPSFAFCVNLDFFLDNMTGVMTVSDNCDVKSVTFNPQNGSTFALGTTPVTATATDYGGNPGTCNFNVTVVDG